MDCLIWVIYFLLWVMLVLVMCVGSIKVDFFGLLCIDFVSLLCYSGVVFFVFWGCVVRWSVVMVYKMI